MQGKKSFLGIGWKFPPEADPITGRVKESVYEENIAQSVRLILQTQQGERVMRPEFGCNLRRYAFSEMNYTVMCEIAQDVKQALIRNEPRIIDIQVSCSESKTQEAVLLIEISYTVRSTNNPYNLVYPFYLQESV